MARLLIGCCLLCGYVGFLVGASQTPVAGTVVTAAIGLAVAALPALLSRFRTEDTAGRPSRPSTGGCDPGSIGSLLIAAAVGLGLGTAAGISLRWTFADTPGRNVIEAPSFELFE